MKTRVVLGVIFFSILFLACAPKVAPVEKPISPQPLTQEAQVTGKEPWEVKWDETLREARKEGFVVIFGPPGADIRNALTQEFEKTYPGIKVDYTGAPGAAHIPRLKAERRSGIFTTDIFIAGTSTLTPGLLEDAIPVKEFLILPEVIENKNWLGGGLDFADKAGKFNIVFSTFAKVAMVYNPRLMPPAKAKDISYWEFTEPPWKGQIIMRDPRTVGPGNASATFFYDHSKLGPDFLKALAKNLVLTRDDRILLEGVFRGKYTAGIGHSDLLLTELRKEGVTDINTQPSLKEGTYATAGFGSLIVLDRLPHSNATSIFLNWLFSRKGQTVWSKTTGYPSRRLDVSTEHIDPDSILKPGVNYQLNYKEEAIMLKDRLMPLLIDLFK